MISPHSAESLIRELERLRGAFCVGCCAALNHRKLLVSMATGFKDAPRCIVCLGAAMERDPDVLATSVINYIQQRACYAEAWKWAILHDGAAAEDLSGTPRLAASVDPSLDPGGGKETEVSTDPVAHDSEWDAGSMACGDLVLQLRHQLAVMSPGQILKLSATDTGAPEDLPAWCRLTGHRLLSFQPPTYWIERKEK